MAYLECQELLRDDADDFPSSIKRTIRDCTHQPHMTATINQSDV
jgi:hypothetical protein